MLRSIFLLFINFCSCYVINTQNKFVSINREMSNDVICTIKSEMKHISINDIDNIKFNILLKNNNDNTLYLCNDIYGYDMKWFDLHKEKYDKLCIPFANTFIKLLDERNKILYYANIVDSFKEFKEDDYVRVSSQDTVHIDYSLNLLDFQIDNICQKYKMSIYYFNCNIGDKWDFTPWTGITESNTIEFYVE